MKIFEGKSINKGIGIGKTYFYSKGNNNIPQRRVDDIHAEIARFIEAKDIAKEQLKDLYRRATHDVGESGAKIFAVHSMLLEDVEFTNSILEIISVEEVNAEYAVQATCDKLSDIFLKLDDEFYRTKAIDIKDISARLIRVLQDDGDKISQLREPVIMVAEDIAPSELFSFDKANLLALVTRGGSYISHTAILARSMNIPYIAGVDVSEAWSESLAIVDAVAGKFIYEPDYNTVDSYQKISEKEQEEKTLLSMLKGESNVTKDGKKINLLANIESVRDISDVLSKEADGIGLFRSEFIFLERNNYPTEDEQYEIYKSAALKMSGKKVVIRTLDIGADKYPEYIKIPGEKALDSYYRGIRLCLDNIKVLKTQLRAIYRASIFGNISIMIPMVVTLEEILSVKSIIEGIKKELISEGYEISDVGFGIMIETPEAVAISASLAKEADFFSIGTNDLTQYSFSIDRQSSLDMTFNVQNEELLKMIDTVIKNGHDNGAYVCICGELGADVNLTEQLIQMGLDEISVSQSQILSVRKAIREANSI